MIFSLGFLALASLGLQAAAPSLGKESVCRKLVLHGEVREGKEWSADLGQGWVFRVVPTAKLADRKAGRFSGWDLVVDRAGGGYPDALLLATPPYGSLNEREIGATFGLRAQDALGWEPRHFRFFTTAADLARARALFGSVQGGDNAASRELLGMVQRSSAGQFLITDAKLKLGQGDAPGYAKDWALNFPSVKHEVVQAGQDSRDGELLWIRFSVTLFLRDGLGAPKGPVVGCPR